MSDGMKEAGGSACTVRIVGHRDAEDIESTARHHMKDGRHYVFFERMNEGEEEKFSLKFDEHRLEYTRRGLIKSTVILEAGEKTSARYITPYGEFEIGFFTTSYELRKEEGVIRLDAEYDMTLNGEPHEPGKILIEVI